MARYQIGPAADASPNDYTPTPTVASHYLNVDEDPYDGDATYLTPNAVATRETFSVDVSAIPEEAVITTVFIRHVVKEATSGAQQYRVGVTLSGVDFYGSLQNLDAGSAFVLAEDFWTVHPITGLEWTKATLGNMKYFHQQDIMTVGLSRPRLTECVVFAEAAIPANTPGASIISRAASATISTRATSARIVVKGGT
jgi:hypothetical protein